MQDLDTRPRTRRRRPAGGDSVVEELDKLVTELIRENTRLKRELSRLEAGKGASNASAALGSLNRRIASALGKDAEPPAKRTRRKITDPAVLQVRREALARAREARAAKRAAAAAAQA